MKRHDYYQIPKSLVFLLLIASVAIPVFRSGRKEKLTFWGWIWNHTIYGPPVEYLPEEDYIKEFSR